MKGARIAVTVATLVALACFAQEGRGQGDAEEGRSPAFGSRFWTHWGDGRAELAGYDLTFPRYGMERQGTAVAIFVTEPFSESARVKSDLEAGRESEDVFQVLKLNLVQDFSTGIYDYNLMTSAFVALEPVAGLPAGAPVKVSFSSQEWCGQVYQQVLFRRGGVSQTLHSYFEGEADRDDTLPGRPGGVSEDALLLWARGLAYPEVAPGERVTVPVLTSLKRSRLEHVPVAWEQVVLSRSAGTEEATVPAGTFEVEKARARVQGENGERSWTFLVEKAPPHRIVAWESSDGEHAELRGTTRLAYWKLNGPGGEAHLKELGLKPRPPATP
jgi:hypothetical protein